MTAITKVYGYPWYFNLSSDEPRFLLDDTVVVLGRGHRSSSPLLADEQFVGTFLPIMTRFLIKSSKGIEEIHVQRSIDVDFDALEAMPGGQDADFSPCYVREMVTTGETWESFEEAFSLIKASEDAKR
jgi:hypothetical protein